MTGQDERDLPEEEDLSNARGKLAPQSDYDCHKCGRRLSVSEVLGDMCRHCKMPPSHNKPS